MSRKISRSFINGRTGAGTGGQGLKVEWDSTNDGELHWKDVSESSLEYVAPFQGSNYGYSSGGYTGSISDVIDRFAFSSNTTATDWGNLTLARYAVSGQSSATDGFTSSGYIGSNSNSNTIDKFSFTSSSGASDHGDISSTRRWLAGQSSSTDGFSSGGNGTSNVIDKFAFSSNTTATDHGNLSSVDSLAAGQQY